MVTACRRRGWKTGDEQMTGEAVKQRVREYMRSWEMTEPGDGILAGVSGGADSVCLLFLLDELKAELGIRLAAFHLNHGLRGAEADRDEAYVKEICGRLGVPLAVAHENVAEYAASRGISGEEAGRILRYEHMKEAAERFSCQKTATAHHRDDSAETVLFNMFRGSGLKGLSGIRPVRGEVIRPLLCLSRAEIAGYLEERGIPWCEDSTNGENVYTRNRIRNQLLPWVKENINARAPAYPGGCGAGGPGRRVFCGAGRKVSGGHQGSGAASGGRGRCSRGIGGVHPHGGLRPPASGGPGLSGAGHGIPGGGQSQGYFRKACGGGAGPDGAGGRNGGGPSIRAQGRAGL